jgi:hypothetical protein
MAGLAEALDSAKMQKTVVQKSKQPPAGKKVAAGQKTTKAVRRAKKN